MIEPNFKIEFLSEAVVFINKLDDKSRRKILYNTTRSAYLLDKELFKKLNDEIWEFRTYYKRTFYRLFAFWDYSNSPITIVICTHGIIKQTRKTPITDIEKAERIRRLYFENKKKRNEKF
jgi:phage-related protein